MTVVWVVGGGARLNFGGKLSARAKIGPKKLGQNLNHTKRRIKY